MTCPRCDGHIDRLASAKWGNGKQATAYAPFICTGCASVLVIGLEDGRLFTPEQIREVTGQDVLALMRSNPNGLWQAIERQRREILSVPGRRPVLR